MKKFNSSLFTFLSLILISVFTMSQVAAAQGSEPSKAQTRTVYIHKMTASNGTTYLTVDPIGWYMGKAADRKFKERDPRGFKELGGALDGYYITNDSTKTVRYPVASNVKVMMQIYDHTGKPADIQIQWNEHVTFNKFKSIYHNNKLMDVKTFPYHITIKDGKITKLTQQFIP
ncbi:hypothetical protein J2Z69_002996 [Paenibacillus shirakamiensis]|uniref:DUF4822 domain-containing protein n=1 Tax=Paenibacillus shirakamiensis TaxID=1265935 RepID=A0ABS4JLH3_9BACL|nr:hypothetical protein [Paenibacillus shirakamiensis]MBP2001940.1 hypothetical protein [Paenibacillus shirakamiensis]